MLAPLKSSMKEEWILSTPDDMSSITSSVVKWRPWRRHGGFLKKRYRIAVAWRVWDGGRGGYGGVAENGVPPAPHTRTQPRHPQPHAHAAATTSGSDAPAQTAATSSGSDAPVTNGGLQREVLAEKTKLSRRRRRRRFS